jgi:hypothetical protein
MGIVHQVHMSPPLLNTFTTKTIHGFVVSKIVTHESSLNKSYERIKSMRMKNENVPNALCPQPLKYFPKKKRMNDFLFHLGLKVFFIH